MNISGIVNILKQNDLSDVEILKSEKGYLLINFYFDFDKDILEAAKAYANDESGEEEGNSKWLNDFYIPYLYDYANDEVLSIVEDISEEFEKACEFMAFQMKEKNDDYVHFMVLISDEDSDISIEDVVKEYMS